MRKLFFVATAVVALVLTNSPSRAADWNLWPENCVEKVARVGGFTTLLSAAEAAGLVPELTGRGQYTLFAPTDEAFANLPAGTVENLMKPENRDELLGLLAFHVVPQRISLEDLYGDQHFYRTMDEQKAIYTAGTSYRDVFVSSQDTFNVSKMAKMVNYDEHQNNCALVAIDKVVMP